MAEKKGIGAEIFDGIKDAINGGIDLLADKVIPQGAAELAHALNSQSNAYVPYGMAQRPLEVEGPQQSYDDMLKEASDVPEPEHGMDMDMDM